MITSCKWTNMVLLVGYYGQLVKRHNSVIKKLGQPNTHISSGTDIGQLASLVVAGLSELLSILVLKSFLQKAN